MSNKIRVLWGESNAFSALNILAAHVYAHGGYCLTCAKNATEVVQKISENEYDVIILNIIIEPGIDDNLIKISSKLWRNEMTSARLGLQLLYGLLRPKKKETEFSFLNVPGWVNPNKIGILFTGFDTEVKNLDEDLKILGINPNIAYTRYALKTPPTILLDMIQRILERNSNL